MSHASVRLLLEDVAKSLSDKTQFGYGRRSEFNMMQEKRYPWIWCLPLSAGRQFIDNNQTRTKTWDVALVFLDQDDSDANEVQSAHILDDQDSIVDRYMHALDEWYMRSYDTLGAFTIQNDRQVPFYKDDADIHTGWLVTFQMIVNADFEYCRPDNIELYAGNI
jgi:hypothetical protein